jgi:hypothetical protein
MKVVFAVDLGKRYSQRARLCGARVKDAIQRVNERSGATANIKQTRPFTDAFADKFKADDVRVAGYTTDAARGDQI